MQGGAPRSVQADPAELEACCCPGLQLEQTGRHPQVCPVAAIEGPTAGPGHMTHSSVLATHATPMLLHEL